MSVLRALLASASPEELRELAALLEPYRPDRGDGSLWLYGAEAAAAYLDMPLATIQKLTADDAIPCHRAVRGGRLHFRKDELNRWLAEDGEKND